MSVLTLAGKPINWEKPPKATTRTLWSNKTTGGKQITGSFRTICALDLINELAKKKFGRGIIVYQGPYNSTIAKSKGTHDFDACLDVWITGVAGSTQQAFFRANGWGAFHRTPAQGFMEHQHMFLLPPTGGALVSKRWQRFGYKVGYLVDGGYSTQNRKVSSSQIEDYYAKPPRNGLSGHAQDKSWHPPNIDATIFNLDAYVAGKQAALGVQIRVATNNVRSLPKNPDPVRTMAATPSASLVMLQEIDIFHAAVKKVPGYLAVPLPDGDKYDSTIIYKPTYWKHQNTAYYPLYEGKKGISKDRMICVSRMQNLELKADFIFISYHDVTKGEDSVRVGLRRTGRANVRAVINRHKALGQPIILGADVNQTAPVYLTATATARHVLDHIYAWSGKIFKLSILATRAQNTWSDHDAWIVRLLVKVSK